MTGLLFRDVEVGGRITDVRLLDGIIVEVGRQLTNRGERLVHGHGGALLPGLHDHHLHLMALAASRTSVDCADGLDALAHAPGDGWIRGLGASESVDRQALDRIVPDRPVRVQHRSGALWMLNTRALESVRDALDDSLDVERDDHGEPTGRLWRFDVRLRSALPPTDHAPGLRAVVDELRSLGITSVTDATPDLDIHAVTLLEQLPIPVTLLGDPTSRSPEKVVISDHDLPGLDELIGRFGSARHRGRGVAIHAVTREALLLALAALDAVGRHPDDRIEHAAVVPECAELRGLRVVTQPGFMAARGDYYLRDVARDDLPCLYRYRSLLAAGVDVVPSSDAPYGPLDPWEIIRAASERRAPSGVVVGPSERVPAETALAGYLQDADGRPRRIVVGQRTDVVLLDRPLAAALVDPRSEWVADVWIHAATPPAPIK